MLKIAGFKITGVLIKSFRPRDMNPRGRPNGENRDSPLWKPPSRKDPAASRGELDLLIRFFTLFSFALIFTGCGVMPSSSLIKNRNNEYLSAKSIPPLEIPAGLSSGAFQNKYPVSDKNYSENAKRINLSPPGLR